MDGTKTPKQQQIDLLRAVADLLENNDGIHAYDIDFTFFPRGPEAPAVILTALPVTWQDDGPGVHHHAFKATGGPAGEKFRVSLYAETADVSTQVGERMVPEPVWGLRPEVSALLGQVPDGERAAGDPGALPEYEPGHGERCLAHAPTDHVCTRTKRHSGDHIAHGGPTIACHTWPQADLPARPEDTVGAR